MLNHRQMIKYKNPAEHINLTSKLFIWVCKSQSVCVFDIKKAKHMVKYLTTVIYYNNQLLLFKGKVS